MSEQNERLETLAYNADTFSAWLQENKAEEIRANLSRGIYWLAVDAMMLPGQLLELLFHKYEDDAEAFKGGLRDAMRQISPSAGIDDEFFEFKVSPRFFGLDPIPRLDNQYAKKFACVEGKVSSMTELFYIPFRRMLVCKNCSANYPYKEWLENAKKPEGEKRKQPACPDCGEFAYREEMDERNLQPYRQIELVILTDRNKGLETEDKEELSTIVVEIKGDLALLEFDYGDTLRVHGLIYPYETAKKLLLDLDVQVHELYQIANNIEIRNDKGQDELVITPDDERKILELAESPTLTLDLASSIAPHIYYKEDSIGALYKEVLLYQGVGANIERSKDSDIDVRGDIHSIMIADPSTGKSECLRFAVRVFRGVYASAEGVSKVGISVGLEEDKKSGRRIFRGGLAVLFPDEFKAFDELNRVEYKSYLKDLYTILDKGIYTLFKIRNKVFKTGGPWAAACNPVNDIIDRFKDIGQQVNFDPSLLNRFDYVGAMTRPKDREENQRRLDTIKGKWRGQIKAPVGVEFLTKYLAYAKSHNKKFKIDEAALKPIDDFFLDLSVLENVLLITERQYEGLIRTAIARARTHLRDYLTVEDSKRAVYLMSRFLESAGVQIPHKDLEGKVQVIELQRDLRAMTGQSPATISKQKMFLHIWDGMVQAARGEGKAAIDRNEFKEELLKSQKFRDDTDCEDWITKGLREGVMHEPVTGKLWK